MDEKYYIANWKSYKSKTEALSFLEEFKSSKKEVEGKKIIVAPPFTLHDTMKNFIEKNKLNIMLAGQNVSPFPQGAYTGEVNAMQLREFADYVIVGHSERRKYFDESESQLSNKIREASDAGLKIIQCVQDENDTVFDKVEAVAYEPPSAIGTGEPDDPSHVEVVFSKILEYNPKVKVLYGGSVNPTTIKNYLDIRSISGFLIGGASLEAKTFLSLLNA